MVAKNELPSQRVSEERRNEDAMIAFSWRGFHHILASDKSDCRCLSGLRLATACKQTELMALGIEPAAQVAAGLG
jgi:hypothetical protein